MNNDNGKALKMTLWLCIGIFTVTAVFLTGKIISAIKTPVSPDVNPQVISEPDTQKQPVQTEKRHALASRPAPAADTCSIIRKCAKWNKRMKRK